MVLGYEGDIDAVPLSQAPPHSQRKIQGLGGKHSQLEGAQHCHMASETYRPSGRRLE